MRPHSVSSLSRCICICSGFGVVYRARFKRQYTALKQLHPEERNGLTEMAVPSVAQAATGAGAGVPTAPSSPQSAAAAAAGVAVAKAAGSPLQLDPQHQEQVKKAHDDARSDSEMLKHEASMMAQAAGPGVLRYHGFSTNAQFFLMQFCAHGSLEQCIQLSQEGPRGLLHPKHPLNVLAQRWQGVADPVLFQVVRLGRDIAAGLVTMHAADVFHGDLGCRNILLDARFRPRIADFGHAERGANIRALEAEEAKLIEEVRRGREDVDPATAHSIWAYLEKHGGQRVPAAPTNSKTAGKQPPSGPQSPAATATPYSSFSTNSLLAHLHDPAASMSPEFRLAICNYMLESSEPQYIPLHTTLRRVRDKVRAMDITPPKYYQDGMNRFIQNVSSDLYALGIVLLEMANCKLIDRPADLIERKKRGEGFPEISPALHPDLARIIRCCLDLPHESDMPPEFEGTGLTAERVRDMLAELHRNMAAKGSFGAGGISRNVGVTKPFRVFQQAPASTPAAPAVRTVAPGSEYVSPGDSQAPLYANASASQTPVPVVRTPSVVSPDARTKPNSSHASLTEFQSLSSEARLKRLKQVFTSQLASDEVAETLASVVSLNLSALEDPLTKQDASLQLQESLTTLLAQAHNPNRPKSETSSSSFGHGMEGVGLDDLGSFDQGVALNCLLDQDLVATLLLLYPYLSPPLLSELLKSLMLLLSDLHSFGSSDSDEGLTDVIFLVLTILNEHASSSNVPSADANGSGYGDGSGSDPGTAVSTVTPSQLQLQVWLAGLECTVAVLRRAETEFSRSSEQLNAALHEELCVRLKEGFARFNAEPSFVTSAARVIVQMDRLLPHSPKLMCKAGILKVLLGALTHYAAQQNQGTVVLAVLKAIGLFSAKDAAEEEPRTLITIYGVMRSCCTVDNEQPISDPAPSSPNGMGSNVAYNAIPIPSVKVRPNDVLSSSLLTECVTVVYHLCRHEKHLSDRFQFLKDAGRDMVGFLLGLLEQHRSVEYFDLLEGTASVLSFLTHPECGSGCFLRYFSQYRRSFDTVMLVMEAFVRPDEIATQISTGALSVQAALATMHREYIASDSLAASREEKDMEARQQKAALLAVDPRLALEEELSNENKTAAKLQYSCAQIISNACSQRMFQSGLMRSVELMARAINFFIDDVICVVECLLALSRVCMAHHQNQEFLLRDSLLEQTLHRAWQAHPSDVRTMRATMECLAAITTPDRLAEEEWRADLLKRKQVASKPFAHVADQLAALITDNVVRSQPTTANSAPAAKPAAGATVTITLTLGGSASSLSQVRVPPVHLLYSLLSRSCVLSCTSPIKQTHRALVSAMLQLLLNLSERAPRSFATFCTHGIPFNERELPYYLVRIEELLKLVQSQASSNNSVYSAAPQAARSVYAPGASNLSVYGGGNSYNSVASSSGGSLQQGFPPPSLQQTMEFILEAVTLAVRHTILHEPYPPLIVLKIVDLLLPMHWQHADVAAAALLLKLKYACSQDAKPAANSNAGSEKEGFDLHDLSAQFSSLQPLTESKRLVAQDGQSVKLVLLILRKHASHSLVVRHCVFLLLVLLNIQDIGSSSQPGSDASLSKRCSTIASQHDGVEIITDVLRKHPYDRSLQSAAIHVLLRMHRLRNLENRQREKLLELRDLMKLAVSRNSLDYLSASGSSSLYPVRRPAFDLLRELDQLIGDRGDPLAVEPLAIKVLGSARCTLPGEDSGAKAKEWFDLRVEWNAQVSWKVQKRRRELREFAEEVSFIAELPPLPSLKNSLFRDKDGDIAGLKKFFDAVVACAPVRTSANTLAFLTADKKIQQSELRLPRILMKMPDPHGYAVCDMLFLAGKQLLILATRNDQAGVFSSAPRGAVHLWSVAEAKPVIVRSLFFSVAVSKLSWDEKRGCVFMGLQSGTVLMYKLNRVQFGVASAAVAAASSFRIELDHVHTFEDHQSPILSLDYHDRSHLLWVGSAGRVSCFDMREGSAIFQTNLPKKWMDKGREEVCNFKPEGVTAFLFVPEHRLLFVGQNDATLTCLTLNFEHSRADILARFQIPAAKASGPSTPADRCIGYMSYISKNHQLLVHCGSRTFEYSLQFAPLHPSDPPGSPRRLLEVRPVEGLNSVRHRFNITAASVCPIRSLLFVGGNGGTVVKLNNESSRRSVENAWRPDPHPMATIPCIKWNLAQCWLLIGSNSGVVTVLTFADCVGCYDIDAVSELQKAESREAIAAAQAQAPAGVGRSPNSTGTLQPKDLSASDSHIFGWHLAVGSVKPPPITAKPAAS